MSNRSLSVVVGNPKAGSRTRTVAEDLAERIAALTGASVEETIDLADHAAEIFAWPSPALDALADRVSRSAYVVFASPTYKASYTGLLKAFLDRYPSDALAGTVAIPVFTIGSDAHALAVEHTLRPLLVELGASVPTRGLSFPTPRFEERDEILDAWVASQQDRLPRLQ